MIFISRLLNLKKYQKNLKNFCEFQAHIKLSGKKGFNIKEFLELNRLLNDLILMRKKIEFNGSSEIEIEIIRIFDKMIINFIVIFFM
jgi:hypothetical protein